MSSVHAEIESPGQHQPLVSGREHCESKRTTKKKSFGFVKAWRWLNDGRIQFIYPSAPLFKDLENAFDIGFSVYFPIQTIYVETQFSL